MSTQQLHDHSGGSAPGATAARGRGVGRPLRRRRGPGRQTRAVMMFLAPFLLIFLGMFVAPIGYAVYQSLFAEHRSGLGLAPPEKVFVGPDNYVRVFADAEFWDSVVRVLQLGVVQVPVMLGLALLLALLLDSGKAWFARFFRLAFFLPFAMPGAIAAILWAFLYAPQTSPIADLLAKAGLHVNFVAGDVVLWSIAGIITWTWTGYNMLIIYSQMQSIPRELYEAATVDGCSGWRIAWHIKVPLVRPALVLTGVFSIIGTLQLFNEPTVLESVAPAISSSYTPIMLAISAQQDNGDYPYAAAVAVVLAVGTFALSWGFLRLTNRKVT